MFGLAWSGFIRSLTLQIIKVRRTHTLNSYLFKKVNIFINMDSTLEDDDSSKGKRKSSELPKKSNKNPQLCSKDKSMDNDSPHCVICLDNIEKKSFANNCLHEFCFECLLKWSKEKAECPLCNGPFTAIIHNVISDQEYEEHIIETTNQSSTSDESASAVISSTSDSSGEDDFPCCCRLM
uniref:E3 ubiquitin-protein ligase Topors n=1 Tax=Daphnia galeata TaxID=27404 RepID=A0A8J2WL55_9CRUS|nr:unnamed protein product [Daphnia galeata]